MKKINTASFAFIIFFLTNTCDAMMREAECLKGQQNLAFYGRDVDSSSSSATTDKKTMPNPFGLQHTFAAVEICKNERWEMQKASALGYHSSAEKSGFEPEYDIDGAKRIIAVEDNDGRKYSDFQNNTLKFQGKGYNPLFENCNTNLVLNAYMTLDEPTRKQVLPELCKHNYHLGTDSEIFSKSDTYAICKKFENPYNSNSL
jgi:hypothetical protein